MNECNPTDKSHNKHDCHKHATCTNTFGSFTCACNHGWEGLTGKSCSNVDECSAAFDQCDAETTTCNDNTDDDFGYACPCKTGYKKVDKKDNFCIDIDECDEGSHDCKTENGFCENTVGSYNCFCDPGYEKRVTDGTCIEINECDDNTDSELIIKIEPITITLTVVCNFILECDKATTTCNNNDGSYTCDCLTGFSKIAENEFACRDVDECTASVDPKSKTVVPGSHECADQATCTNTFGSYTCKCLAGYKGDGKTCDDVNECDTKNGGCDPESFQLLNDTSSIIHHSDQQYLDWDIVNHNL